MTSISVPSSIVANLSYGESTAITDSVYRATMGIDTNDKALFNSAWLNESEAVFEMNNDVMTPLSTVYEKIFNTVGPMDTTHCLQNVRITHVSEDKKEAKFMCYAMAQHYRPGQGLQFTLEGRKNLLGGSIYWIDVAKDELDGLWKMKKWSMKLIWADGDMSVLAA